MSQQHSYIAGSNDIGSRSAQITTIETTKIDVLLLFED